MRRKAPIGNFPAKSRDEAELLRQLYLKDSLPVEEIAARLGVGSRTIWNRLAIHGIHRKHGLTGIRNTRKAEVKYCTLCGQACENLRVKPTAEFVRIVKDIKRRERISVEEAIVQATNELSTAALDRFRSSSVLKAIAELLATKK